MFYKTTVLMNLRNLRKFKKGLEPPALLKKRPRHKYFLVSVAKTFRIAFLKGTSERLLSLSK